MTNSAHGDPPYPHSALTRLCAFVRPLLRFFYRVQVIGLQHIPPPGTGVLVIANHVSLLDAVLLTVFLPMRLTFAINTQFAQRWWMRPLASFVDFFTIDPANPMATREMIHALQQGKACAVFPEGRLTVTGGLMKIYEGTALMADKADALILPVQISGVQFSRFARFRERAGRNFFPGVRVRLTILAPRRLPKSDTLAGRDRRKALTLALHDLMMTMQMAAAPTRQTLWQALHSSARLCGWRAPLAEDASRTVICAWKLVLKSAILARGLRKQLPPGNRVGLMLPNTLAALYAFFALHCDKRIPAMINFTAGALTVLSGCHTAELRTVLTSRRFVHEARLASLVDTLQADGIVVMMLEDLPPNLTLWDTLAGFTTAIAFVWHGDTSEQASNGEHFSTEHVGNGEASPLPLQDPKSHSPCPNAPSPDPCPHDPCPHDPCPRDPCPHDPSPHDPCPHDTCPRDPCPHDPSPHDPAVILFTSGSEGKPKAVFLSHNNILANHAQLKSMLEVSSNDRFFCCLPIFHAFGLCTGVLLPLLNGIRVFLYPSPLHYQIIPELVYDDQSTVLLGTDTFFYNLARAAQPLDFCSVRFAIAGGERLKNHTTALWAEKFAIHLIEGYGATETSPVIAVNTRHHHRPGTVGRVVPGLHVRLQPMQGTEGHRLQVRGPNVMLGVMQAAQPGVLVPPTENNQPGWYDTGDVVTLDPEGFVTIQGRARRFAKRSREIDLP